jgi:hypothetical protein
LKGETMAEEDGPDTPVRIVMHRGTPGERGYMRVVQYHDLPFSVTRTRGPSPEIHLMAKDDSFADGAAIRITEAIARQLVEDLTRALDAPGGWHVTHHEEQADA